MRNKQDSYINMNSSKTHNVSKMQNKTWNYINVKFYMPKNTVSCSRISTDIFECKSTLKK